MENRARKKGTQRAKGMNQLPKTKTTDVAVQKWCNQVFIYDKSIDNLHCLNETSSIVYQACRRGLSFEELKAKKNLSDELILLTLSELKRANLLETSENFAFDSHKSSKHEVIRKIDFLQWFD